MKIILSVTTLLLSLACYGDALSFGEGTNTKVTQSCPSVSDKKIPKYTIQLISTQTVAKAKKTIEKLPNVYKKDTHLYKVGCYIAARYKSTDSKQELKPMLKEFQKLGFKDALIIKSTKWHMKTNLLKDPSAKKINPKKQKPNKTQESKEKEQNKELIKVKTHSISKFVHSNMILKADQAYKNGDESTAMVYYEMLYNAGGATRRIKNNLCYLYGKRGAWLNAKEIIEKEKYASKFIYAYAYGALESNQDHFIQNLSEYILIDKTGKLALLGGYYYEQKEDMQRALGYYKMAYEKNPSNWYNIYAYARALDIQNEPRKALRYYEKVLAKMHKDAKNYQLVYNRVQQLRE